MVSNNSEEMKSFGDRLRNFSLHEDHNFMLENDSENTYINDKVTKMMEKMQYTAGSGLGKNEQGITKAINVTYQHGRKGLGNKLKTLEEFFVTCSNKWDFNLDNVSVKEEVTWIKNKSVESAKVPLKKMLKWMKQGHRIHQVDNESKFCDKDVVENILKAKGIFDEFKMYDVSVARTKANPFETIRSVFFMNRAALKIANIDAITNFMFTKIDENDYFKGQSAPFYFADVCAGPGGFTEYILWRRKWYFKGFGLTYIGENDFRLEDSTCNIPVSFQKLYGPDKDGNICSPQNIMDFRNRVKHETDGKGVHFMMSDGGFSVEGNENMQEVLSKHIYLCQCLVALEIVRTHGNFVTKMFDIFTTFSVGLLYLMYQCFEKVSILKPNTSRPANAERYFICQNLLENERVCIIRSYLWTIALKLWDMLGTDMDVLEIVPLPVIMRDQTFLNYIIETNNRLGIKQIIALKKLAVFCQNPNLIDARQEELREKCLEFWNIPDKPKTSLPQQQPQDFFVQADNTAFLFVQPREVDRMENLTITLTDIEDWHYCPMSGAFNASECHFYASIGNSKVYRQQNYKWMRVKNLDLCRGTLLYGEMVKEKTKVAEDPVNDTSEETYFKNSLHVIDALRLGDTELRDLTFAKRRELIGIYCKSVNKESHGIPTIRVRLKPVDELSNITTDPLVLRDGKNYCTNLSVLGYQADSESIDVNSLMLLKTNEGHSFFSTYVLRVQVKIKGDKCLNLSDIITEVKNRM